MPDVEFFYESNDLPLRFEEEDKRYLWRQYKERGNWYVRVSDPSISSVAVKVGTEYVPLERYVSDNCFIYNKLVGEKIADLIERQTRHQPDPKGVQHNPGGWVAELDLWSMNGNNSVRSLQPSLYVEPGNLSDKDFGLIVDKLKELALFRYSPTKIQVEKQGGSAEGGMEQDQDEEQKQAAEKFLALINQIKSDWSLVQAAASRETQLLPSVVDVSLATSYSARIAVKKAQHPHARRIEVLMPQESFATIENRFLVYVLDEIRRDSPSFISRLVTRAEALEEEWKSSIDKEDRRLQSTFKWKERQTAQKEFACDLKKLSEDIEAAAKEVAPYIDAPFLRETRDNPLLPSRPTDRLTRSFAYGPIYNAFCDYQSQPGITFAPLRPGVMEALESKAIHPACTLYELWVFIELYEMLIRTFGFLPPAAAENSHPFDYVDSGAGEIVENALKGKEFRLELRPTNNFDRVIKVSLWYDTEERQRRQGGSRLRPDIYLEIKDSAIRGSKKCFAVDAKYRSYPGYYMKPEREQHGVKDVFDLDLLVTAKKSYRGRLACDAAFIVHPDHSNKDFEYWGGDDKYGKWPVDHRYGAIFANPSDTSNLRRMLKCFLMYHMDVHNTCWSCRNEIAERNVLSKSDWVETTQYDDRDKPTGTHKIDVGRQPVGHDYLCDICQTSWTRTWCMNPKIDVEKRKIEHRILKLGRDDFHDKSHKGCICPTCGNGRADSEREVTR